MDNNHDDDDNNNNNNPNRKLHRQNISMDYEEFELLKNFNTDFSYLPEESYASIDGDKLFALPDDTSRAAAAATFGRAEGGGGAGSLYALPTSLHRQKQHSSQPALKGMHSGGSGSGSSYHHSNSNSSSNNSNNNSSSNNSNYNNYNSTFQNQRYALQQDQRAASMNDMGRVRAKRQLAAVSALPHQKSSSGTTPLDTLKNLVQAKKAKRQHSEDAYEYGGGGGSPAMKVASIFYKPSPYVQQQISLHSTTSPAAAQQPQPLTARSAPAAMMNNHDTAMTDATATATTMGGSSMGTSAAAMPTQLLRGESAAIPAEFMRLSQHSSNNSSHATTTTNTMGMSNSNSNSSSTCSNNNNNNMSSQQHQQQQHQAALAMMQQQQQQQQQGSQDSSLHEACRQGKVDDVERIMREDPPAAFRAIVLKTTKNVYDSSARKMVPKIVNEPYKYPLNLALKYKADPAIVEALLNQSPQVLAIPDGYQQEGSLHIVLKHDGGNENTINTMLLTNPEAASMKDRHGNTPLHTACIYGASLDVVRHLCAMYPAGLQHRNFHSLTPLQLAQRSGWAASNEVAAYLMEKLEEHYAKSG